MPGYRTRELSIDLGGHAWRIQALQDLQQFDDPDQAAERMGISSAQWSLFGNLWPAGRVLAQSMCTHQIDGKRILELGCGLALASLVLRRRDADVTASDYHPLAEHFLHENAVRNRLSPIPFRPLNWEIPDPALGRFDLIIGSDILYERGHARMLDEVLERHAAAQSEVVITDPGRGHANRLSRMLLDRGYTLSVKRAQFDVRDVAPYRGRILTWRRG